jgi:ParB family transcriptional regulator, chromosome partitioning protein
MSEKRRALGRGLGALIPSSPSPSTGTARPVDVFFRDSSPTNSPTSGPEAEHSSVATVAPPTESVAPRGDWYDDLAPGHPNGADGRAHHDAEPEPAGEALAPVPGATFAILPIAAIRPNPRQPRTVFDEDELDELAASIREIGVLQPVVVRPVPVPTDGEADSEGPRYELIMGERRLRASQLAGEDSIPAIVKDTHDDDLLRNALLENLHRSQLNPLEEAAAYQQLLDDFGCSHEELATRIGRSRPQISNTIRLLRLPPLVARRVAAGVLSAGHARALLGLDDGAAMERLAQRIVAEGLSVRSVEEIVALGGDDPAAVPTTRRPRAGNRHPQLDDLAARLSDRYDTRVTIALGQRKGKLTVEFASVEDLNRIVALMDRI